MNLSRKMRYFNQAHAARAGLSNVGGPFAGFGLVAKPFNDGTCAPGSYLGPPGPTGNRYCRDDLASDAQVKAGDSLFDKAAAFFKGKAAEAGISTEPAEKKYTVSFTPQARQMIDASRGDTDFTQPASSGDFPWGAVATGALALGFVGMVVVIARSKK